MREGTPATHEIADEAPSAEPTEAELALALEIVTSEELFESGDRPEQYVARHLAETRAAAYAAGLEAASDDAHESGRLEGLAPVQHIAAQIDGRLHLGPTTLGRVRAIVDDALGRTS